MIYRRASEGGSAGIKPGVSPGFWGAERGPAPKPRAGFSGQHPVRQVSISALRSARGDLTGHHFPRGKGGGWFCGCTRW